MIDKVASYAYQQYLQQSKGQLSPDDAKWITEQYFEDHPNASPKEAIDAIVKDMINQE